MALTPPKLLYGRAIVGELSFRMIIGTSIVVVGLDKPERIEGQPWDGGLLDEYANMKPQAWTENVRPALSDRGGWCDFLGVPEGRNHYYDLDQNARALMQMHGDASDWGTYHWKSADILPPEEIAAARADLDELTFQQEYEASFVSFTGLAYHAWDHRESVARLNYDPNKPLIFVFDFNVSPGIAAVIQEQVLPNGLQGTGVIGEVWIKRNSNTLAVCRRLIQDWGDHPGEVHLYGDATGGAKGSAKVQGSDWDLIRDALRPVFGDRLRFYVGRSNPPERVRVNAVNSRLCSASGQRRLMVDPANAPNVVKDFEGVTVLEGGTGEIDKKAQPMLSHLTDAIGYYVEAEYPTRERKVTIGRLAA